MRHFSLPSFFTCDGVLTTGAWDLHKSHAGIPGMVSAQYQHPPRGSAHSVGQGGSGHLPDCSLPAPGPRKLEQRDRHFHRIPTCIRAGLCCSANQGSPHHRAELELSHGHPGMGAPWRHHIFGEAPSSLTFRPFYSTQSGT